MKEQLISASSRILDYLSWFPFWFQSFRKPGRYYFSAGARKFILRKNTSDFFVIDEVFNKRVYGNRPLGIVFDVGANIGAYALYAAQTAERVFAFEPESDNYALFQKNLLLNNLKNVEIFKKAIGDVEKSAFIYKGHFNKGMASTVSQISNNKERIEMVSLKDAMILCGVDHIDTLKIDIEGGEYLLIENIPDYLFNSISSIVMEFHRLPGKSFRELVHVLEKAGYRLRIKRNFLEKLFGVGIIKATKI